MSSVHDNGRIGDLRTYAGLDPTELLRAAVDLNDRVDVCRQLGITPWRAFDVKAQYRTPEELAVIAFRALLLRST